jgi:hypothetical protein
LQTSGDIDDIPATFLNDQEIVCNGTSNASQMTPHWYLQHNKAYSAIYQVFVLHQVAWLATVLPISGSLHDL